MNSFVNCSGIKLRFLVIQESMASIPRSIGIEIYKLSMSHEQSILSKFKERDKNRKKSQSYFTYVVRQGTIGFNRFSIRQMSRLVGLSGPDIIGLVFRSSG